MKFIGTKKVFSTENEEQYVTIGTFWDGYCSGANLK